MRKRNVEIKIRLTPEENSELKAMVKKSGFKREKFMRLVLLGTQLKEKPPKEFYDYMNNMSAIGNRLNQIAIKANALGFIDAPLIREELDKLSNLLLDIREHFLIPERKRF